MTYKCLEEHVDLGITKQVGEHLEVDVQVQVERERGEAETNVTQDSEIQPKEVLDLYIQVDGGTDVEEGSRITVLATGDGIFGGRRGSGGGQGTGDGE